VKFVARKRKLMRIRVRQKGADVRYHDPYVPGIRHNGFEMAGETGY
jgi:hypothetical protein